MAVLERNWLTVSAELAQAVAKYVVHSSCPAVLELSVKVYPMFVPDELEPPPM